MTHDLLLLHTKKSTSNLNKSMFKHYSDVHVVGVWVCGCVGVWVDGRVRRHGEGECNVVESEGLCDRE